MKKKIFLLTFVCIFTLIFSFITSAYECPFYSIEIDDEFYAGEDNTDTVSLWLNDYGSCISINITPNNGIDFSSISESEVEILTNSITSTYENLDLDSVENIKGFQGTFCSINSFNYTLDFSANGADYSVEGFVFPCEKYLYTIETSSYSQNDRVLINQMLNTFSLPNKIIYDENEVVLPDSGEEFEFVSDDGVFSFTLPSGFVEQNGVEPIEKQWLKNDSTISVAFFTLENTECESLVGLSEKELDKIVADFVDGSGADLDKTVIKNVSVNGYDGIKINTIIKSVGLSADTDIYSFSTEDSIAFIYFYRYGTVDEKVIDDILDSLSIKEEILVKSDNSFVLIGTIAGAFIGAIIAIITSKRKKKPAGNINADAPFGEYPQI